jgi:hypothetical protein
VEKLAAGETTINAGAVYPYDVLKHVNVFDEEQPELDHVAAQWQALPNYVGNASILPMVDVSGSMTAQAASCVSCLDVAVSLGLYVADKNRGPFKDTFLTFSSEPQLLHLQGNIVEKVMQMVTSRWEMSTSLDRALDIILKTAVEHRVPAAEMPQMLIILSDMQFNAYEHVANDGTTTPQSAIEMIATKYAAAGYQMPAIVFWNLNGAYANAPVAYDASGVAMVSGFSPVILKSLLSGTVDALTPEGIMRRTVMIDRYAL